MSSAPTFIDAARARARQLDQRSARFDRSASVAELVRADIPSGKLETWKYTRIQTFLDAPFADGEAAATPQVGEPPPYFTFAGATPIPIRGANADLSALVPAKGVRVSMMHDAPAPHQPLNERVDLARYPLAHVNTALLEDALLIDVAAGIDGGVLDLRFGSGPGAANISRVVINLAAGSTLKLVEQRGEDRPTNSVLEIRVAQNATLHHTRVLPALAAPCWHLLSVDVGAAGAYSLVGHALGATTRRCDIHVRLTGHHATTNIDLACATTGRDRLDHQVVVEHVGTHTVSRQVVRGVAAGSSELTFNGRIHIHPHAQRSDAQLTNKNLLLDRKARINTKPELEIYANDVKCSHGATVGQIDAQQVFYLRSRGLDESTARAMLTRAFFASLLTPWMHDAGVLDIYSELFSQ